jgi:hypothetical protein
MKKNLGAKTVRKDKANTPSLKDVRTDYVKSPGKAKKAKAKRRAK